MADPAVDTMAMGLGAGVGNAAQNNGPHVHHASSREDERDVNAYSRSSPGCGPSSRRSRACAVYLQAAQDVTVGARFAAHAVPIHAAGRQSRRAQRLGAEDPRQAEGAAAIARRRDRPAERRHDADARTSTATWPRASASSRSLSTTRSTTPSANARSPSISPRSTLTVVIEEVLPQLRAIPRRSTRCTSARRISDQMVPMSAVRQMDDQPGRSRCRSATRASSRRSPSASISRPDVALRHGDGGGPAGDAGTAAAARRSPRPSRAPRRRSRNRSTSVPLLILAALVCVYIILGMLYESFIHPLTILSTLPSAGVWARSRP